jgi:Beta-ketoacyl synthase, N-terminal domain
MRVYIEGVGLCGPGLDGWTRSRQILAGTLPYEREATRAPPIDLLPANERRRAVQTARLALCVGIEALAMAARDTETTPTVFTSSGGDGATIDEILKTLALSNPEVSPTRFHNSVHNAPAGYWGIAARSHAPSSSICCHDHSFAAGLLEAAVTATSESRAVAVIAYDVQYPEPLHTARPIGSPFATALALSPEETCAAFAMIDFTLRPTTVAETRARLPALEALRNGTPAARGLPLLEALAQNATAEIVLSYLTDMELVLHLRPLRDKGTLNRSRSASLEHHR